MVIIGIDQSLSNTGISLIKRGENPLFCSIVPPKGVVGVERLDYISRLIVSFISENIKDDSDVIVCREDYAYSGTGNVFSLGELGGAIDLTIFRSVNKDLKTKTLSYYTVPINSWKLLVLGNGAVKKDTQYLLKVFEKTKTRFDNDNIADAYMISLAMLKMIDYDFDKLTVKEKFGMISSSVRKKNKITEKNISSTEKEWFEKMVGETFKEYLVFSVNTEN